MVLEARKLEYLLINNRDATSGDAVLTELFQLDPHHSRYLDNLGRLIHQWPRSKLRGNIEVRRARMNPSLETRLRELWVLVVEVYPGTDAAVEGWFYLATDYLRNDQLDKAREAFAKVIEADPDSPWADDAKQRRQALSL